MLKAVRGIYEGGVARPLEPIGVVDRAEVIITFLDKAPEREAEFLAAAGSWHDVDTETMKRELYEERLLHQRPPPQL